MEKERCSRDTEMVKETEIVREMYTVQYGDGGVRDSWKKLDITADRQSMPTADQDAEGVPRELEKASVRLEDASRDGRHGTKQILASIRGHAVFSNFKSYKRAAPISLFLSRQPRLEESESP